MKKFLLILPFFLVLLVLFACASTGRNFDETKMSNIKNGQTTRAQIDQWFGPPTSNAVLTGTINGAVRRYTYTYAYSSYGGLRTTSKALVVDFNDKDIVVDNAYSSR
jgi:hypothetical protein